jgi:hypothetical protein
MQIRFMHEWLLMNVCAELFPFLLLVLIFFFSLSPSLPLSLHDSTPEGDVLEIIDGSNNWWYVRNARGEDGIVPSNYVKALVGTR